MPSPENPADIPLGWDEFLAESQRAIARGDVVPMQTVLDMAQQSLARMEGHQTVNATIAGVFYVTSDIPNRLATDLA